MDASLGGASAIYCHCALVFNCEPATSEVEDQNGLWVPVCERCQQIAFDDGRQVRKLQRQNYITDQPVVVHVHSVGSAEDVLRVVRDELRQAARDAPR